MPSTNETYGYHCRFLTESHFDEVHATFVDAYSDYFVASPSTETQFRNHLILNGVDLTQSIGCFDNGKMIGFTLNSIGEWDNLRSAYDAGTGVISEYRRRGVSNTMFDMMMPAFKSWGVEQCLLEVITTNEPAIKLYDKHGFRSVRELALLQCDVNLSRNAKELRDIQIVKVHSPDWDHLTTIWDGKPSWQNSIEAMKRSYRSKRILSAILDGQTVGYIVYSSHFGRVAQIAVDQNFRGRGIGTALLGGMQDEMADGYKMQVINIDKSIDGAMNFFRRHGFYEVLSQHEMVKAL